MKRFLLLIATVALLFSSCKTHEKILYMQDITVGDIVPTQALAPLKYMPGDKMSVIVTSSSTPQLAMQFNLPVVTMQAGSTTRSYSNQIAYYTVDEYGKIDVPTLGSVKVEGLTRGEAAAKIQAELRNGHLRDAVVTVNSHDQYLTVLGEVKTPGRVMINKDNMTILEAIGQVGDLTIQGRRDQILVIRQEGNESKTYYVDLRSKDLLSSPVYNLQQNDVVYVQPNKVRMGQSTNNDNSVRSIATWLSISSVLTSIAILITNAVR